MNVVRFAEPLWLLGAILALPLLGWSWRWADTRRRAALKAFAASPRHARLTASISVAKRWGKRCLYLGSVLGLFVALARPQTGGSWQKIPRRGIEVLFAVDTSRSMLTPDVKPNRLVRSKLVVEDLVDRMNGDGVGLIAFAGTAFLQCPITTDREAFDDSLAALDAGVIPVGGTDIASAIREAQAALQDRPATDRILILLTDGEDLSGDAIAAAQAAAKSGLKICTVGVGTAGGELIPVPAEQGGGFVQDQSGRYVRSRLDETRLRAIAAATGGIYAPLGSQAQGLETIYRQELAPLSPHALGSRLEQVYREQFQWPLGAALACLLGATLIGDRRRQQFTPTPTMRPSATPASVSTVLAALAALLLMPGVLSRAQASPASAAQAYQKGDYLAAERQYLAAAQGAPRQPLLPFNAGAAAYRAGDYSAAATALKQSVSIQPSADPQRLAAQEDAYYDLGNTLYRAGQKTESANAQQTMGTWTDAVKTYDSALQLRPGDADAKFNRDLVQRRLEELQKREQQKKQEEQRKAASNPPQGRPEQSGSAANQSSGSAKASPSPGQHSPGGSAGQGKNASGAKQKPASQPSGSPSTVPSNSSAGPPPKSGPVPQPASGPPGASPAEPPKAAPTGPQPVAQASGHPGPNQRPETAPAEPGQMSRADAQALLDSAKDEQRQLPGSPVARTGSAVNPETPVLKDW